MIEPLTFKFLQSLKDKRIRVGDIEGLYKGGQVSCGTMGKVRIKVDDIWVTLAGREKSQIVVLDD